MSAYPSGVPTVKEITKLFNNVTPRNAESIDDGVGDAIRTVMDFVNQANCGKSASPIAIGYIDKIKGSGGYLRLEPATGYTLRLETTTDDGDTVVAFDMDETLARFHFNKLVRFKGYANFDYGVFTEVGSTSSFYGDANFFDDVNFYVPITIDTDETVTGVRKDGGFRPDITNLYAGSSGNVSTSMHTVRLSHSSGGDSYLPIINTCQGQMYYFVNVGISNNEDVICGSTDVFYGGPAANDTQAKVAIGGYLQIMAMDDASFSTGDIWWVMSSSGVIFS